MIVPFLDLAAGYQELKEEIDAAVARVLASGWYIGGEEVEAFEAAFAEFCETRYAISVGNGLDALVLALRAMEVGPGDEVIVPSHTYVATWLAVTNVGATIVPVEPEQGAFGIDPVQIENAITPYTKAIIPVHLYGTPVDLAALMEIADRYGLQVLEDAAQAHGARYRGKRIGGHGRAVAWSFYPGKNLGAFGDGGAVTTNDEQLARRIRMIGNYGSSRKYEHEMLGVNSRLDPVQAAILGVKLPRLDEWNERRRALAARYQAGLRELPIVAPAEHNQSIPVWHLFVIQAQRRAALASALARAGIGTLQHYPKACFEQEAYQSLALDPHAFPLANKYADEVLSLPIGPHMRLDQVDAVVGAIADYFDNG